MLDGRREIELAGLVAEMTLGGPYSGWERSGRGTKTKPKPTPPQGPRPRPQPPRFCVSPFGFVYVC